MSLTFVQDCSSKKKKKRNKQTLISDFTIPESTVQLKTVLSLVQNLKKFKTKFNIDSTLLIKIPVKMTHQLQDIAAVY